MLGFFVATISSSGIVVQDPYVNPANDNLSRSRNPNGQFNGRFNPPQEGPFATPPPEPARQQPRTFTGGGGNIVEPLPNLGSTPNANGGTAPIGTTANPAATTPPTANPAATTPPTPGGTGGATPAVGTPGGFEVPQTISPADLAARQQEILAEIRNIQQLIAEANTPPAGPGAVSIVGRILRPTSLLGLGGFLITNFGGNDPASDFRDRQYLLQSHQQDLQAALAEQARLAALARQQPPQMAVQMPPMWKADP